MHSSGRSSNYGEPSPRYVYLRDIVVSGCTPEQWKGIAFVFEDYPRLEGLIDID